MQDTVDPAAALPRTLAQIIEDTRRAACSLYPLQRGQRRTCLSLRARGTAQHLTGTDHAEATAVSPEAASPVTAAF
jgi:hypothetical protein